VVWFWVLFRTGTVVIDTSSSSPYDTRELGADLLQLHHKIDLIDAPVTQNYLHAIRHAAITLMIGYDSQAAYETASPVLQAMSKYTFVMGQLGAGHAMKTLNNYVSVGSILALCDALVAGQKFGLDPRTMIDVLNVGTGRNFSTANSFRSEVRFHFISFPSSSAL
jgi:3-hydroxyisobutyrate dehydrogenase-like beta-hydroxyacid dehydrogenase